MDQTLLPSKSTEWLFFSFQKTAAFCLLILLLTSISHSALASRWYVTTNGTGTGSGSWDNASSNLQTTINNASADDEVWVAIGIYQPVSGSFSMKEGVRIYGSFQGTETSLTQRSRQLFVYQTILTGGGVTNYTVTNSTGLTKAAVLDGFLIRGGVLGGVINYSSPKLVNLVITGNGSMNSTSGAMYNFNCAPQLLNVRITANAGIAALFNDSASPLMVNCSINNNTVSRGHVFNWNGSPVMINCTVAGEINFGEQGVGVLNRDSSFPKIYNSIISGEDVGVLNGTPDIQFSMVYARSIIVPGQGRVPTGIDALFSNPGLGDYGLTFCSPAINAGSNAFYDSGQTPDISDIITDAAANFRINGTVDQGAYEFSGSAPQARVPGVWYVKPGGTGKGTSWDCPAGDLQFVMKNATAGEQVWVAGGTYQPADNGNFSMKEGVKIYGGFAGNEASLAARDLSIVSNKSILQAYGHTVLYNFGVTLTTAAVLDGFTIRGSTNGPGIQNYAGSSPMLVNLVITENTAQGGMTVFDSSPVMRNCSFIGNSSSSGGALLTGGGSPKLINCSITGNSSTGEGGGIFSYSSSPVLINCLIKGNTANGGGGLSFITSTPLIINCTLVGNTAANGSEGGGILNRGASSLALKNSIVYGNSTGVVNTQGSTMNVQYSLVQGQDTPDEHNIAGNTNPLFVDAASDNYRLQPCSPAVNAGFSYFLLESVSDLGAYGEDLDGNSRISESVVDMGAFESNGATRALAIDGDQATGIVNLDLVLKTNGSNCKVLAYVSPIGDTPLIGEVTAKVWVKGTQPVNFLKRHYQITPATNADHVSARVTLYFTQEEFTLFNAVSTVKLPIDAADEENYKANLLIEKRSGVSRDNSGLPSSYSGSIKTFNPTEANGNVTWNAEGNRWEVTFDVTGFSGFFVKTIPTALPLRLISFTAVKEMGRNVLQWSTASEVNTNFFEIQRSGDGRNYMKIAKVDAAGSGSFQYRYDDAIGNGGTIYYRLKMSDLDGTFTYSKIISLAGEGNLVAIYPNPAGASVTFQVSNALLKTTANLYDITGRHIQGVVITNNEEQIDTKALVSGSYILKFADGTAKRFIKH